nr:hypothetical protein [uncultured Flavobacterium sp.]
MRYFISSFLLFFILNNHCSAQNEKLKLSSIIDSTFLSQNCSYLVTNDEKLYFFTHKDKKVEEIINFDCYNSHGVQIIYTTNKKNILKKLKKVESACVLFIKIISQDQNELILRIDLPITNYQLYLKNQFTVTLIDSWLDIHYTQKNGKWVLTKMTCNGF